MLIGTLPVIIPVTATVLAGAFMLKEGTVTDGGSTNNGGRSSIADVALLVAAVIQGTCLLWGIMIIEQTATNRKDEQNKLPYDEEVLRVDEERKREKEIKEYVSKFSNLEPFDKTLLSFSTMFCLLSFWLIFLGPTVIGEEAVLRTYEINDSISKTLNSKVWTVVTDVG